MLFGAALSGCAGEPRAPEVRGVRGKRELFGDPALVPTRAGERAREELALADAVVAALRALGGEALAVEVRLPRAGDPGAVVVTGQGPPGWDEAATASLVSELCGPWSAGVVRVAWRGAAPSRPARGAGDLPLVLALVGLGAAGGVTVDRLLRRRARSPLRG
ncbi:hypothetical protein [Nannocystis punicea]|uniref:Uncharacterized protein n=1 Tax=Nannocystis punicea TaxID=2995304 RepID=A0ABY7HFE5_9BACT|nr:hypothetical protein [Nannocystis poenicansa]WAS97759.1 hypothetical protein O0S08_16575 [Nannocystis poenicansa]